jgi:hypothetical protein
MTVFRTIPRNGWVRAETPPQWSSSIVDPKSASPDRTREEVMKRNKSFWNLYLILSLMAVAGLARAQTPSHFTVHHTIQFMPGTERDRQLLKAVPAAQGYIEDPFEIAREDLNDDGRKEIILISTSSMSCGSHGCSTVVLEDRGGTATVIGSFIASASLGVTNEKVGSYRALARLDLHGAIILSDWGGTPKQQLVLRMEPPPAAQAAPPAGPSLSPNPSTSIQSACAGSPNCAEVPTFVAMVTDFRLSKGGAYLRDRILTATVRFTNKTDRTLVLGYVQNSGVALDDQGNRYRVFEETVRGIGTIARDQPDPKFSLAPGERADARFEFIFTPGNQVLGTTYEIDLTVREIDAIAGNQWRLGREHALHFRGFTDAGIVPTASSAPSPTTVAPGPAPPAATGASSRPGVDPCGSNLGCFSAGPFMAQVTRVITRLGTNSIGNYAVRVTVKLTNVTNQPVILGYVAGTGAMTDNLGNRYSSDDRNPSAVSGIGLVLGPDADPQFALNAGESRSAVFELRRTWRQDVPSTCTYDLTLATLEIYPSQQVRVAHQYAVGFKDLPVNGPSAPAVVPAVGPCAGKPHCDSSGPFIAEVTHVTRSLGTNSVNNFAVRVTVKLTNITKQPIILGYVTGTGALFDNLGRAYADWAVTGIGTVDKVRADPQFKLNPGQSRSAEFEWRLTYRQDGFPRTYAYDLTIAQLEILPSTQVREIAEYSMGFTGLTAGLMDELKGVIRRGNRR